MSIFNMPINIKVTVTRKGILVKGFIELWFGSAAENGKIFQKNCGFFFGFVLNISSNKSESIFSPSAEPGCFVGLSEVWAQGSIP